MRPLSMVLTKFFKGGSSAKNVTALNSCFIWSNFLQICSWRSLGRGLGLFS